MQTRPWIIMGRLFTFQCAVAFVALASLGAADLENPSQYEGKRIAEIEYMPPTQPLGRAELARLVSLKVGSPLRTAEIRTTLRQLYRTGEFSNVEVDSTAAANGVKLVIRTTEQYFIGPVEVHGKVQSPPNSGQLVNVSRLNLGAPFSEDDLQGAIRSMRNVLQRNGLYLATIDPKIERDREHQQVAITFQVNSGTRARLTEPTVMGDTRLPVGELARSAKYKFLIWWKSATQSNMESGLDGIRKKYAKDDRLKATVALDRSDYIQEGNRVRPVIEADGGPKVDIKTMGAKVSKGKLRDYVPVFDEGQVNRDLLVIGARNLRDYFQDQGYFDVQVNFKTSEIDPDHQEVDYEITPGARHSVVRVAIQGNQYFTTKDIRERMFLQPKGLILLRHGRYSDGFVSRDEDSIKSLYRDNGFLDVGVNITAMDDYQGKKGAVAVTVHIDEGAQFTISQVEIRGMEHLDEGKLAPQLAAQVGQPFSETSMGMDRTFVLEQYHDQAYPDAEFDYRQEAGSGPHQIRVLYTITEGHPRYVQDVLISGLHHTRRSLLKRSILLKPGAPLSWTDMGIMQRRLYNLGVFDRVDMGIQDPDGDAENKNVLYQLTEGRRYYVGVGFGAEFARIGGSQTSLDNPAGTAGFAPRGDLELSRYDMFGLGHSLNFKSRYSTLDRRVSLEYSIPHFRDVDGRNISITGLYDNVRDVLTFTGRRVEGSAQISKKLNKADTALFRYTWRDVTVDPTTLKINPLLIPSESQAARLGILATTLVQDKRDNPVDAHRGVYNSLDMEFVDSFLGGNKNFLRFLGRNSFYKRVHGDTVIASNTELGVIHPFSITSGVSALDYVPIPERFFSGGSTSIRAFPDNQAGPRDPLTGFPIGGNAVFFHTTELRFPLMGANVQGVLFHDMGNVYSGLGSISFRVHQRSLTDFDYMAHAAGFGIRYRTPVGPIRLDLAYSINPPTFNGLQGTYQQLLFNTATPAIQHVSHFQFFFSIGQAF